MRLIITRHGETEENKANIIQGHLPAKLSQEGIDQAKKLALRLKDEKIDYIYSSDLARASNTAIEIHKYHKNTPLEFVGELREKFLGGIQGLNRNDPKRKDEELRKNIESNIDMYNRAKNFLHEIIQKHNNESILFVCHNHIGRMFISAINDNGPEGAEEMDHLLNTSITILEINEDKKHKILVSNCIKHLNQ